MALVFALTILGLVNGGCVSGGSIVPERSETCFFAASLPMHTPRTFLTSRQPMHTPRTSLPRADVLCLPRMRSGGGTEESVTGGGGAEERPHTLADTGRAGREIEGLRHDTRVANAGRRTEEFSTDPLGRSVVNVPVYHASTVTFPSTAVLRARPRGVSDVWEGLFYGRFGSATHRSLEDAFAALEGGHRACSASSLQAAMASVLLGVLQHGDRVLFSANAAPPVKSFCAVTLSSLGVKCSSFPACISPALLEGLFAADDGKDGQVKVVVLQGLAPPELELPDLAGVAAVAHRHGAIVIYDNSWTSVWAYAPIAEGADVVVASAAGALTIHPGLIL